MALSLKDVTVVAADCVMPHLAARALNISSDRCDFADALLFSDQEVLGSFRHVPVMPMRSRADYSRFMLKELVHHIRTSHVLVVQWDGYVLDPRAWKPSFLNYDYMGAPWPWYKDGMDVGNGGFSLRSRKLLEATAGPTFPFDQELNEDEHICRNYRDLLERSAGIRIARTPVAKEFSYERDVPEVPTFGFHGLFNMWRHVDDTEMMAVIDGLTHRMLQSGECSELLAQYISMRKFPMVQHIYQRRKREGLTSGLHAFFCEAFKDGASADYCMNLCEKLVTS